MSKCKCADTRRLDYLELLHSVGLWGIPSTLLDSSGSRERIDKDMADSEMQEEIRRRKRKINE